MHRGTSWERCRRGPACGAGPHLEVLRRRDAAVGPQERPVGTPRAVAAARAAVAPVCGGRPARSSAAGLLLPARLQRERQPAGSCLNRVKLRRCSQRLLVRGPGCACAAVAAAAACCRRRCRRLSLLRPQPGHPVLADEVCGGVVGRRLRRARRQREVGAQGGPQGCQPGVERRLVPAAVLVVAQAQLAGWRAAGWRGGVEGWMWVERREHAAQVDKKACGGVSRAAAALHYLRPRTGSSMRAPRASRRRNSFLAATLYLG